MGKNMDWFKLSSKIIDTNNLAKVLLEPLPIPPEFGSFEYSKWNYRVSAFFRKGQKTNVKELCKIYGIEVDETKLHNALYDLHMNFEIFKKQIWKIDL